MKFINLISSSNQKIKYKENLISAVGGFLGIFSIFMSSQWLLDPEVAIFIVPSMGASAVLLFAAPHTPFSQPWNVIGGHAISAIIGVACWQWIPNLTIAASSSVCLAIGAMYLTRCIHPPGGATALAAVIGSEKLHQLGYSYELKPILLNALTILLVAFIYNGLFKWRRYPACLYNNKKPATVVTEYNAPIKHADFVIALIHIDTIVEIKEEDLLQIYQIATKKYIKLP